MRLLLAEDEKSLARAIVAILKKNNYEADAVFDGEEALEYLQTGNYDGAILDVMMPRMDGITVIQRVRASGNEGTRSTRTLVQGRQGLGTFR